MQEGDADDSAACAASPCIPLTHYNKLLFSR